MDSVVKSMSDLVKVKDEDQITPYVKDPESGGEVDVAKEQLDVLVKIQHDLKRQQVVQQATLTSQFLLGKMQETMAKLLTERSKDFERQRKEMMLYMEKESNLHQNSMDQIGSAPVHDYCLSCIWCFLVFSISEFMFSFLSSYLDVHGS